MYESNGWANSSSSLDKEDGKYQWRVCQYEDGYSIQNVATNAFLNSPSEMTFDAQLPTSASAECFYFSDFGKEGCFLVQTQVMLDHQVCMNAAGWGAPVLIYSSYTDETSGWSLVPVESSLDDDEEGGQGEDYDEPYVDIDNIVFGHEYVDLGLPSGTLWASCNIGATSPEKLGYRYAWGETTTKDSQSWSNYKYCNGTQTSMTKYCTKEQYGIVDSLLVLEPEDDAAAVNWGGPWRMATVDEWRELKANCKIMWTTVNGIKGSRITGKNGNSIFLPYDEYWTSTLSTNSPYVAYDIDFDGGGFYIDDQMTTDNVRYTRQLIRPVTSFNDCSSVTSVTIPDGATNIGYKAFSGCNITSITIPSSVTSIEDYAFSGCDSLTSVTMESAVPCTIGETSIFPASNDGFKIYVPYGSGDTYKNADGWSVYADYIEEMPSEEDVADNLLYMEDSKTFHKSQLTIPVLMKNAKPFTAFQCDITLPEGLTLHKTMNEDDEEVFDIAYGSRAKSTHSLLSNQMTNGNIRVVGYSSSNSDYRDSEGMFFTLTVDVANDASGDLPIKLSNVILTSATDGDTECPDMEAVLTIIPGQPGDVNGDGKLTMGDVVKLVNNILEVSQTGFNADLADVNEDGKVTMGDVVIVLNMILSGEYPTKVPSMRQPMAKDEVEYDVVL